MKELEFMKLCDYGCGEKANYEFKNVLLNYIFSNGKV